jgi:TPR repeat protein
MQDAKELFYESVKLGIRAKKAPTPPAQRDALHAKQHSMLHRVLRVDPTHIGAQHNLGVLYEQGKGVQQDFKQALVWYRKAADQGLATSQCSLGGMYFKGQGVQQDDTQAAAWLRKAADQGHTMAHLCLGDLSEWAGDYQAAFASFRAGQAGNRDAARDGMCRCLEKMAEGSKKDQGKKKAHPPANAT